MKKLLPLIFAILITNTVLAQLPVNGLVAWYPFCNDNTDHSGNGFDLTNTGATITNDRNGNANNAFFFNGGVGSGLNYSTIFAAAGDWTYACWINAAAAQSSVIWYNGDPSVNGFGIFMNDGTIGTPGSNLLVVFGGGVGQFLSTPISLNVWHHILLSKNGGAFRLYIDGSLSGFFTPSPSYATPAGQFTIGQDYLNPGTSAFNGDVDDFAIYNRYVSGADLTALYNFDPSIGTFNLGISGADTGICGNSITLTPHPYFDTSLYHYSWNTGDTTISINVSVAPNPGSTYALTLSKPYGCVEAASAHIHQIRVVVDLGPRRDTFCHGTYAILNAHPTIDETVIWNTGETTDSITVSADGTYWVTIDSTGGCKGSDTISIVIADTVLVNIGPDSSSCDGTPITLASTYTYPGGTTYQWGGFPVLSGITTAPTFTTATSGMFWLTVKDGACYGSDTAMLNIVYDSLVLITQDTTICKGNSVQIRAHGNPFATDSWSPTTGIASAFSVNPLITPDTSSWYVVTASLSGCQVKDSLYINVEPVPTVYIGGNKNVCRGDTLHITAIVTPMWYTHYIYNWTPGTNLDHSVTTATDSALGTVVFTSGDTTSLILTVSTPAGCFAVDSALLMSHTPQPTVFTDSFVCPGDSLILNPAAQNGASYAWHPGRYLSDSTAVHPIAKPITTQQYWIESTDRFGCHDTMFQNIRVFPNAVIYLGDSVKLFPGESFQISPQTNCVSFSWSPPLGLSDTSVANPIASPAVSTKFIVNAMTEWGCKVTDSLNFHVDATALVALPNAFTPGNGVNNYFTILTRGVVQLRYFRIFNRWGNKVFETNNISQGWDGTFNGKPQPIGVYVYDVEAVTNEGSIFHTTGNVTLIR